VLCWRRTNAVVLDQMDVADSQFGDHKSPRHHLRTRAQRTGAPISLPYRTITPPFPHRFPPIDKHVSSEWYDHQRKSVHMMAWENKSAIQKNHFLFLPLLSCAHELGPIILMYAWSMNSWQQPTPKLHEMTPFFFFALLGYFSQAMHVKEFKL
jgi:hypothetical protein